MKIESRRGMVVEMSDAEYERITAKHGEKTKYFILNRAGRIRKHREFVKLIEAQQLNDGDGEQQSQVTPMCLAINEIYKKMCDLGYGNYVSRPLRGELMAKSWELIMDQVDVKYRSSIVKNCGWKITVPKNWGGMATTNDAPHEMEHEILAGDGNMEERLK